MRVMTDHTQNTSMTLVLGATGKTGRRVLERLEARGVPTRSGSRSADPPFDWDDRETWEPALEGVDAVYISYFPDLAVPGSVDLVGGFARLAAERGVRRLVLLAGRGEEEAERCEQAVREAGAPEWTIVRSTWFDQNFSEAFMAEAVVDGVLALPVTDVREPFVDAEDIADVAVAALTEPGHHGETYELTGPRLLTFADAVAEIAEASGRDVRYQPIPLDTFKAALTDLGLSPDELWLLTYLFTEVLDGRNAKLADGVQRALGREPRDFREFAREAAASGAWNGR
jgi:uncharacterized protein YbjT (DUF2867 family)